MTRTVPHFDYLFWKLLNRVNSSLKMDKVEYKLSTVVYMRLVKSHESYIQRLKFVDFTIQGS